jgi:hypothetical protein
MLIMKKNLKRALSLLLAATMTLSMSTISAFADETESPSATETTGTGTTEKTTEVKWVTELPVTKCIKVAENAAIPEQTFTFTMTPATQDEIDAKKYGVTTTEISNQTVKPGIDMTSKSASAEVEYTFNSKDIADTSKTTSSDGVITVTKDDKSFNLSSIAFSNSGIYRYYITEDIPDTKEPYIEYDSNVYIVDLYVVVKGTENGKATYGIKGLTITESNGKSVTVTKPTKIVFTNTIKEKLLTISKDVVGDEYTKDELFDFWIKIPVGGDTITLTQDTVIYAKIYDDNGQVTDKTRTYINENGLVELKVNGEKRETTETNDQGIVTAVTINDTVKNIQDEGTHFQLKNGERLEIYAPVTMIYYVVEKDYSSEGYAQTYTYEEDGKKSTLTSDNNNDDGMGTVKDPYEAKGVVIKGTVNTGTNTVAFINTRNVDLPNTGINLDLVPYILLTLIAVCGGILFISRKKRVNQ